MYSLLGSIHAISSRFQFHCVLHSQYLAHCTFQLNPTDLHRTTCVHTNIKRVLPAPPRDLDFSDVSLKTLLVLVHRRIFRPSHAHLLGGASVSRPHHCQPQWVANNSLWASAWATTRLFHVVEQMTGPSAFDFVVPVHPSRCSSTRTIQYRQDLSLATLVSIIGNSSCNILIAFFLDRLW